MLSDDGSRHFSRRKERHQDNRHWHREDKSRQRILRRDRWRDNSYHMFVFRHSCQHITQHRRFYHRRRLNKRSEVYKLGNSEKHLMGVDIDHPCAAAYFRCFIFDYELIDHKKKTSDDVFFLFLFPCKTKSQSQFQRFEFRICNSFS